MNETRDCGPPEGRWRFLALMCIAVVGSLTTWFSATAVIPELERSWQLSPGAAAWLTNGVQIGFVAGALGSSLVNLPDVVRMNRLMAGAAALAAAANALLLLEPGVAGAVTARVVTGIALAGVYPPALKLLATWFRAGRGLALGFLIGALTLGSALPHLFRGLSAAVDWRSVVLAASASALLGAVLFATALREGPFAFARATFNPRQCLSVFSNRPLLLANIGYFGHMWELYAMWGWFLVFLLAAADAGTAIPFGHASLLTFWVIAAGVIGCILGGWLSDRIGRSLTTALMMAVSGTCAALIGFAFHGPGALLGAIAIVWEIAVVGDSAQFSAAVTELCDQRFVGTALALQLGIGFGLTVFVIWLMPLFASQVGWQWAFVLLVPGPAIGALAMLILRRHPAARRMAGGRR